LYSVLHCNIIAAWYLIENYGTRSLQLCLPGNHCVSNPSVIRRPTSSRILLRVPTVLLRIPYTRGKLVETIVDSVNLRYIFVRLDIFKLNSATLPVRPTANDAAAGSPPMVATHSRENRKGPIQAKSRGMRKDDPSKFLAV
jgi:hypothetical protein